MLDKIKQFAQGVKDVLLYVLLPIAFVVGYIWKLTRDKEILEDELKAKDGTEKLNELKGQQEQIDSAASDAVSEYERLSRAYLSGSANSMQQGGTGAAKPDPDKGSGN